MDPWLSRSRRLIDQAQGSSRRGRSFHQEQSNWAMASRGAAALLAAIGAVMFWLLTR